MTIRHYRLVRNHLGSDRKECLRRNLRRNILYKKKKKERKKERRVTKSLAKDVGGMYDVCHYYNIKAFGTLGIIQTDIALSTESN